MKIFQIDDGDYVAAESLMEARDWYSDNIESDIEDITEITPEVARSMQMRISEDGPETTDLQTYLEQCIDNGEEFPQIIASDYD